MAENVGGISVDVTLDNSKVDPALAQLNSKLNATASGVGRFSASTNEAAQSSAKFGSNLLIVGQFADDVQYGLRAVVNQTSQLVGVFGGSAGLAGVLTIVAVAANQLIGHWDQLISKFTSRGPETAAQEMKRLGENTSRTADEQKRLNDLKEKEQQIDAQKKRRPAEEGRGAKEAGVAITEAPRGRLKRDIEDILMNAGGQLDLDVERRQKEIERTMGAFGGEGRVLNDQALAGLRTTMAARRRPAVERQADEMLVGAEFGSGPDRDQLRKMAQENPEAKGLAAFEERMRKVDLVGPPAPTLGERNRAIEDLLRTGATRPDLEGAYQRGLAEKREEDARAGAWGGEEQAARAMNRVEAHREAEEEKRERKRERAEGRDTDAEGRESIGRINERLRDNQYQIFQAMNPTRVSQRMGLEQYDASIAGMTGESPEAKRLHQLVELQKENNKLLRERAKIGAVQRRT